MHSLEAFPLRPRRVPSAFLISPTLLPDEPTASRLFSCMNTKTNLGVFAHKDFPKTKDQAEGKGAMSTRAKRLSDLSGVTRFLMIAHKHKRVHVLSGECARLANLYVYAGGADLN